MQTLHQNFALVVVATNLFVGAWGLFLWRKKMIATRRYWMSLGIAWATIYIQGLLGLAVYKKGFPLRHTFYGFLLVVVTMLILPLRGERPDRRLLIFAGATLFIGIVAIRAIVSGHI